AAAHRRRERAVVPDGLLAFEQEATNEICGGEVFVACDRDERTIQTPRHVLDEARFAAAGRAFEHDGQTRGVRRFEQLDLAPDRQLERLVRDDEFFNGSFRHYLSSLV